MRRSAGPRPYPGANPPGEIFNRWWLHTPDPSAMLAANGSPLGILMPVAADGEPCEEGLIEARP